MAVGPRGRVLVLEDDESLQSLFEKVLIQSGFETSAATTVADAQVLFAQKPFDVVVCDLSVAGGNNVFDFVSLARRQHPGIAVLIITGYTPDDVAHRAARLGVDLLEKPFTPLVLIKRVSSLLDRKVA